MDDYGEGMQNSQDGNVEKKATAKWEKEVKFCDLFSKSTTYQSLASLWPLDQIV